MSRVEGDIFAEAIRTKTTALSQLGYFDKGSDIRENLLIQGFFIAERSTSSQPMNIESLNLEADKFLHECRKIYHNSIPVFKEYYPE